MEDFALLGNAAAVPIIIGITQLLKKNFSFKYKADVVSAAVAFIVCPLWWFYNTPEIEILDALDDGIVATVKFVIQLLLISGATWLSAAKSYDLFAGNKKRDAVKQELQNKITELESKPEGGADDDVENNPEIVDRLRQILEG
jgi:hypothetical protein